MTSPVGGTSDDDALAERLRLAQRRVASLDVDPGGKQRAFQRLLAITDAAKHDTARASARLDSFLTDLDAGRIAAADASEPPAAQGD